MSRPLTLLLVLWNVVLSILVGFALIKGKSPAQTAETVRDADLRQTDPTPLVTGTPDTLTRIDARIAYFSMDSIENNYALVKESADRVRAEGRRLETELGKEIQRAQGRAQELATKDHTYSTQAQIQADQEEFQELEMKIQDLRMSSQDKIEELQIKMLSEIAKEVEDFLKGYNQQAGFDYIFSIQDGGQIWVGNEGLDITADVVSGLNARHQVRKGSK